MDENTAEAYLRRIGLPPPLAADAERACLGDQN